MAILKNISPDGVALTPAAYELEEITICNKDGKAVDVQYQVQEITITESIYSPTLICTVSLSDESDLIEVLPVYGMETIYLKIKRQMMSGGSQEFEHTFYVTDYPLYGRPSNREHMQAWSVTGVSKHVWKNPMLKLSRAYDGKISDQIVKIAKDAFELTVNYEGDCEAVGRGIINMQTPMKAMDWFRRRMHDPEEGAPYYLFQSIENGEDNCTLTSHTKLVKGSPHNSTTYTDSRTYTAEAGTPADFNQRKHKIIGISSSLKLSKFTPISQGTWGSQTQHVDLATRTFGKEYYTYKDDFKIEKTLLGSDLFKEPKHNEHTGGGGGGSGSPTIKKNEEKPEEEFYACLNCLSRNSEAYEKDTQNYIEWTYEKLGLMRAYPGVFNTLHHTITLFGDLELNAGKIIDLQFPRAGDPMLTGGVVDEFLSGNYLVTSAIHRFKNQEYYTEVKVKRDSLEKA